MMDTSEAVVYLARAEAHRIRAVSPDELDELDAGIGRKLPAFRIESNASNGFHRLRAVPLARDPGHDNADRLDHVCAFLNRRVLPMIESESDVRGIYRIELHDSYTYLAHRADYRDVFSFGRAQDADERRVALFPDPYHFTGSLNGLVDLSSRDAVPWAQKRPSLFFAGTTTGLRDPRLNARLRACAWASSVPDDDAEMYITQVAQIPEDGIAAAYSPGLWDCMKRPPVAVESHWRYRYLANIEGNTACWSRVPMILSSGSLMVHVRHADAMWYSPLLRDGRHYVGVDGVSGEGFARALAFCRTYDRQCRAMVSEANALARQLFDPSAALPAAYTAELLQESSVLYGR